MNMTARNEKGQIALILVLAATVAGTLVMSLADRSTRNVRTQTLDIEKVKALKGAESGIEQALLNEGSVGLTNLTDGVNYSAEYVNEGVNGVVSGLLEPGDVFDVLVDGADNSVNSVRIYFSSEGSLAALKVSDYRVDESINEYIVNSYGFDGDSSRALINNFSDTVNRTGFNFKDVNFDSRGVVNVNANIATGSTTRLLRVMVLYSASKIGVQPLGGDLPNQQVVVSSVGSYSVSSDVSVKKRLELKKEMEKVPPVFDKVLYSKSKLIQ